MEGISETFGLLGAVITVCLWPVVVLIEKRRKKTLARLRFVFDSLVTFAVFAAVMILFVRFTIMGPFDTLAGEPHVNGYLFFYGVLSIAAVGRYILLMLTIRRLRDIGWTTWLSIGVGIPGFVIFFWLLLALWPGKREPEVGDPQVVAES